MIYTHWIIENIKTGERDEKIIKGKKAPCINGHFKIIECCGYHEKPNKGAPNNDNTHESTEE